MDWATNLAQGTQSALAYYTLSQVRSRIRNRALLLKTISRASLAKQISREDAKTQRIAHSHIDRTLRVLLGFAQPMERRCDAV